VLIPESVPTAFPSFVCVACNSQNRSQKYCPNMPPTRTCGSSQTTQLLCCAPFNVTTRFSKFSFVVTTSFTFASFVKIPSTVCAVMGVFKFSTPSYTGCFTIPSAVASSSITRNDSSYSSSRFCFPSMILFISWFNYLFSTIAFIFFVGGSFFIVSLIFYAFFCILCNLCSNACNSSFSGN
jgi:hypothetical protein